MRRTDAQLPLCPQHVSQAVLKFQSKQNLASELLGPIDHFHTAAAINHALGRLYVMLAGNRIPPRNAAVLAYICQLMNQTRSDVETEINFAEKLPDHNPAVTRTIQSLEPLDPDLAAAESGKRNS